MGPKGGRGRGGRWGPSTPSLLPSPTLHPRDADLGRHGNDDTLGNLSPLSQPTANYPGYDPGCRVSTKLARADIY
jgi:hypothetical protein